MNLHIETTNRCVLECPGCPRTQWRDLVKRPVDKSDLDAQALERFLDCDGGRLITDFTLCGDYGDVIYYPALFEFLQRFRSSRRFHLHTNGSHQRPEFWHRLREILTESDTVTFAVDGLEDTNAQYRVRSDWHSIMQAIGIMSGGRAPLTWKTIVFAHNYQQLAEIKQRARALGCQFRAEKTHRFGRDDLRPPAHLVEDNHEYQSWFDSNHAMEIEPSCVQERTVGCDGILYPCDWIRHPRTLYKSQLWHQRWLDRLRINDINYDQAMDIVQQWADWVRGSSLAHSPQVDVLCRMKCRQGCRQDRRIEI